MLSNLDFNKTLIKFWHKFFYCQRLMQLKRHLKRSYEWRLKKIIWIVFFKQALPRLKMKLLNLDIHQFYYSVRLIHLKRHLKISLIIELKENPLSHFSLRESLPKLEIGIPNLDFHQCSCSSSKQLFYPKWHLKGNYYILFEKNHSSRFLETHTSKI